MDIFQEKHHERTNHKETKCQFEDFLLPIGDIFGLSNVYIKKALLIIFYRPVSSLPTSDYHLASRVECHSSASHH